MSVSMKKNISMIVAVVTLLTSCAQKPAKLSNGRWYAEITVYKGQKKVPFIFEIIDEKHIVIHNADERLKWERSVKVKGDSVFIPSPIFNTEIRAKIKGNELTGAFYRYDKKGYKLPFYAKYGNLPRYEPKKEPLFSVHGKWATVFKNTNAIGEFKESEINGRRIVKGSFITETGDYRYLQGIVDGDSLKLSGFDGLHVWVFEARIADDEMEGAMYSGVSYKSEFTGKKGVKEGFLRNANELTYLKKGYKGVDFSLPDVRSAGNISLKDKKYENKVVILQIMGTWCPNCMDETAYFSEVYDKYRDKGLEIISLGFEFYANGDLEKAKQFVRKSIEYHNAKYDFAIAVTDSGKTPESVLPQLNKIMSYPTSIYIGRDGKIKKIHTGFSGPATDSYEKFTQENGRFIENLLDQRTL